MTDIALNSISDIRRLSTDALCESRVAGEEKVFSFGRRDDLDEHAEMLRREFAGEPAIALAHALTIVEIRRSLNLQENLDQFRRLWLERKEFLCAALDSRWLVSACDTIIDHDPDAGERGLAMAGVLMISTVKLYETERQVSGVTARLNPGSVQGRIALHDGLSAFCVGQGDMVYNLLARLRLLSDAGSVAACILLELVRRSHAADTVFARMLAAHQREETDWTDLLTRGRLV